MIAFDYAGLNNLIFIMWVCAVCVLIWKYKANLKQYKANLKHELSYLDVEYSQGIPLISGGRICGIAVKTVYIHKELDENGI